MSARTLRSGLSALYLLLTAPACEDAASKGAPPARPPEPAAAPATAEAAKETAAVKLCVHGVPADLCTQCNPDLIEVYKAQGDWCDEHGVPESLCKRCNPNLDFTKPKTAAKSAEPWCNEHGVPEAKCTKCKPQLVQKFIEAGDFCREHGFPESVCPICHPERVRATGHEPPVFPPAGTRVKLASAEVERAAGIATMRAEVKPFARRLDVVGQLDFNQNRLAELSARGEALVAEVMVDVGDKVRAGQPLVALTSASVGGTQAQLAGAKARLDAARATLTREEALTERGISPKKVLEESRAAVATAEAEHEAALAGLRAAGAGPADSGGRYMVTAPFAGTVVFRDVVAGKSVAAGQPLVKVADLRTMWALLEVPEESAGLVKPGQHVQLTFEPSKTDVVEAVVSRVAPSVDHATRTVQVRVDLPNPDGALKAGLFIRASIQVGEEHGALLIPKDAVQRAEGRNLVFVRSGDATFTPEAVEVAAAGPGWVAVTKGLTAGAEVVTTGAFLLKTEILKDSIGAGCADD